ncbi:2-oxoacid:acceptor oxidoreductase subunit alpha [Paraclostridium sordellii]|uniref:2-oxoacid:acceptor oxidoreductase subunit alpha n=1 Tax=Paraclostridium sordellii TaxID=1505 RepID=UPI000543C618|nr:2-oxoacid:acceptor oxidoreductase subunit alpha [Paeniclostridium sordellii]MCH1966570.1 2-oxoacid:acceptor oxidoreductase subunit alpha [Paeniclostridium sordellii]MCQ4697111.1 2-oxoacid:acceptor oxidoreductase subunit alpha [Paeniclostridium sordellii]MDU4413867.1 2-oxoacid:acceptor oxidoreductase subunit alpha [Paeniclostridium sordellii]MRZ28808.1 2-oxoacid:acceptor oxidoreductase subunit alpha [Paeniclostridium sordellii]MVO75440.1 2-oxoacid:acceptor oxidoreductase subunit alpha [Paeni
MLKKVKLLQGNEACVHGALYAGMNFFAGYPITPSTEVAEISSYMLPKIGGKFIQMEDEIASMAATIGASLTGLKSMTATSGPGFSLKQENIGYAALAEIPCVIVNVQRCGPSTGLPTSPAQGDLMQAKWGTHGDHPIIALSPTTVRDTFDLTVKAFNFSEKYRTPVILLLDEVIGHMREKVEIPQSNELEIYERMKINIDKKDYKIYDQSTLVPPMANFSDGYRYHVTGLMHDETGFPTNSTKQTQILMDRLMDKINKNLDDILIYDEYKVEDCEELFITFGCMSRCTKDAVDYLREQGIKAGLFTVKTVWPFPEDRVKELSSKAKNIYVPELNYGQMVLEVQRVCDSSCNIIGINKYNGEIITPDDIIEKVMEVGRCQVAL